MSQRLERLVNLLAALIDTKRPLSRDEIYSKVPGYSGADDAKRRAFERDKDTLRQIGVPIKTAPLDPAYPEHGDGYLVPPSEYYLPDPELTRDELSALAMAASSIKLEGNDPLRALYKLGADPARDEPTQVVEIPDNERLGIIFDARRNRQTISFTYRGQQRRVDPYRLTFRNGHWYVNGMDHARNDTRTYRLDRIEGSIEVDQTESFEPPTPTANPWLPAWEMGAEEPVEALVRIDPTHASLAIDIAGPSCVDEQEPDGSVVLKLHVTNRDALIAFVFEFLEHAELLEPPELRERIVEHLEDVANLATASSPTSDSLINGTKAGPDAS